MKLATLDTGGDGTLVVVSRDLTRGVRARAASTLQSAMERWTQIEDDLRQQYDALNVNDADDAFAIEPLALAAILPRGYQFLDASAFLAHNHILAKAWGFEPRGEAEPPLMYQGLSNEFYPPHGTVSFANGAHDVDFEAEFGVITDVVPRGVTSDEALPHARLIILINDWSLRAFGPEEMRGGFGFLHAKPPSTLSSFAMTPDELGTDWRDGRVCRGLRVERSGHVFGQPNGSEMHFGFGELIAHAARTRHLSAATVIGSGTVSNYDASKVGSACIAERRALDALEGKDMTPYLADGETVRLQMVGDEDRPPLGLFDQRVAISSGSMA
jgi:fumarylacetoacetate (FAA) hydrolase